MRKTRLCLISFVMLFASACSLPEVETPKDFTVEKGEEELSYDDRLETQDEIIRRQRERIAQQERELLELRRQQELNQRLRRYEDSEDSEEVKIVEEEDEEVMP